MIRLMIAVAAGILVGLAATFLATSAVLTNLSNGTPSTSSIYNYGNR